MNKVISLPPSTLNYIEKTRNKGLVQSLDNFNDLNQLLETKRLLVNSLLADIESKGISINLEEKDFFISEEGKTTEKIKSKFEEYLKPIQAQLEKERSDLKNLD
jgi:hypothetical protein